MNEKKQPAEESESESKPYNVDGFLQRLTSARNLGPQRLLYFVTSAFKENLIFRYCQGGEIFQSVYDDPAGKEYWRGWFEQPSLTVERFASLLEAHSMTEWVDQRTLIEKTAAENNDEQLTMSPIEGCDIYDLKIQVVHLLQDAAHAGLFDMEGDLAAFRTDNHIRLGWVFIDGKTIISLDKIKLYRPLEVLKWFSEAPERRGLLPKSLCAWWDTRSSKWLEAAKPAPQELGMEESAARTDTGQSTQRNRRRSKKETLALIFATLFEHPYWKPAQIAAKVEISRQYLYSFPEFLPAYKKAQGELQEENRKYVLKENESPDVDNSFEDDN